jgi:hypothetical protein
MNEQELRGLVREAVERHLGRPRPLFEHDAQHTSHILLNVVPGSEIDDGTCLIEPAVRCNHCGFCRSYGH